MFIPGRSMGIRSIDHTEAQVQHIQHSVQDLACLMTPFTDWWSVQVVVLEELVNVIPQIQCDGSRLLHMSDVHRRWENVIERYRIYSSVVTYLVPCRDLLL